MSKITICFIVNSIQNQRCFKRIMEFKDRGYNVKVFGFSRKLEMPIDLLVETEIIGCYSNEVGYLKRSKIIYSALKKLFGIYVNSSKVIWYYFGLDIALFSFLLNKNKKYFYEESDLTHTYIKNKLLSSCLEFIDKKIIKNSIQAILTSEGFVSFHDFNPKQLANVSLIPNKLNPLVLDFDSHKTQNINYEKIKFGFVGMIRYRSVYNMAEVISRVYPNFEFHFYGTLNSNIDAKFRSLEKRNNIFFHGAFINPNNLSEIYNSIDIVISTYDTDSKNVLFAEPNKIYEAIYFRTPIVVSSNTYLEKKVKELNIGYSVNADIEKNIIDLVDRIQMDSMEDVIISLNLIDKNFAINNNNEFFERISTMIEK